LFAPDRVQRGGGVAGLCGHGGRVRRVVLTGACADERGNTWVERERINVNDLV